MRLSHYISLLLCLLAFAPLVQAQQNDYNTYHKRILEAEKYTVEHNFDRALEKYDEAFAEAAFVFLRDCKIATQLAAYQAEEDQTFKFLRRGAVAGWELKEIRRNAQLKKFMESSSWSKFEKDYPDLRKQYETSLNQELQARVKKMYSKDQKKAMGALFRIGSGSQDKYAEQKFAPHSEQQIKEFLEILMDSGYPGEKLIGNDYWASTILSHHNSISENYNRNDSLYPEMQPELLRALSRGEVSPFELALIDEWYRSTLGQGSYIGYGILDPPTTANLTQTNALRAKLYLRSVETRNALVDIQEKIGINFELPGQGWIDGKIEVLP